MSYFVTVVVNGTISCISFNCIEFAVFYFILTEIVRDFLLSDSKLCKLILIYRFLLDNSVISVVSFLKSNSSGLNFCTIVIYSVVNIRLQIFMHLLEYQIYKKY